MLRCCDSNHDSDCDAGTEFCFAGNCVPKVDLGVPCLAVSLLHRQPESLPNHACASHVHLFASAELRSDPAYTGNVHACRCSVCLNYMRCCAFRSNHHHGVFLLSGPR